MKHLGNVIIYSNFMCASSTLMYDVLVREFKLLFPLPIIEQTQKQLRKRINTNVESESEGENRLPVL